jgi:hypothetical protein
MADEVGRNDACPCGSGKKYKKCCIDRPTTAAALRLTQNPGSEERSIELLNLAKFDQALGTEVLAAFARCFVQTDRLVSLVSFAHISSEKYGDKTTAFARDLHTMVWFTVGTLRELALAIQYLRSELKKKDLLKPETAHWVKLREIEDRWNNDSAFRKMRDRAGFHVDEHVMVDGVKALVKEVRDVELFKGDNEKQVRGSFTFGTTVMHNGLGWENLDHYGRFLEKVSADHSDVVGAIQHVLIEVTEAVGIEVLSR